MKQKILELLTTKFQGVNEKTLSRIAEKIAKTVITEEDAITAAEGVTFQQVLESYGDARATEAQQTAIRKYEAKHGLKDGRLVEIDVEPQPQPDESEKVPAWAKALLEANKTLKAEVDAMRGEKLTADRRSQINSIISPLPNSVKKVYEHIPVTTLPQEEFEALKTKLTAEVEEIAKDTAVKGVLFGKPYNGGEKQVNSNGGKAEATKEEVDAVMKHVSI